MREDLRKAILKDENKDSFFNRYGYIYIPNFIDRATVHQIKSAFDQFHIPNYNKNQWNSQYDLDYTKATQVSNLIKDLCIDSFSKHFVDFEIPIATIMSKNPIHGSTCELHRDFTVFDENEVQFRNFWIPLIDINEQNGALYVIPGSKDIFTDIRPMFADWAYKDMTAVLMSYRNTFFPKAGDLVVYADRTLHGSLENQSNTPRPVIHGGILPPHTQLYYYQLDNNNMVNKFEVEKDFFMKGNFSDESTMKNYNKIDTFEFHPQSINKELAITKIAALYQELN